MGVEEGASKRWNNKGGKRWEEGWKRSKGRESFWNLDLVCGLASDGCNGDDDVYILPLICLNIFFLSLCFFFHCLINNESTGRTWIGSSQFLWYILCAACFCDQSGTAQLTLCGMIEPGSPEVGWVILKYSLCFLVGLKYLLQFLVGLLLIKTANYMERMCLSFLILLGDTNLSNFSLRHGNR
jgi:hypothetical protein